MKKVIVKVIIFVLIVIVIGVGFFIKDRLFPGLSELEKEVVDLLRESEKKIFLPSPLVFDQDSSDSFLNKDEIIRITNIERQKYGLAPLKENTKLDSSAELKAEDLFSNQYFEHESPTGVSVSDLAARAGYDFVVLGENLARGNFQDDQALVRAWMDSPGHRENILNPSFSEIGVSVIRGMFEREETWIAVQHFALSLSACPEADESLKAQIEANESEIADIEQMLGAREGDLRTRKDIREYNSLVSKYNNLIHQNKILIEEYNSQINTFNQCLNGAYNN